MQIIFLGMNKAGEEVLNWLRDREDVKIEAVIEEKEGIQKIQEVKPELVVSSGFEHKVPQEIIDIPEKGIINLHPSFLPFNRGAHPYIWPIIEETPAGVSIHFMNNKMDEGPVIARKKVEKRPGDDAKDLRNRLMEAQADLFKNNWDEILESSGEKQDLDEGNNHYKKDLDEVSQLDLDEEMKLKDAINLLRGLTYGEKKLAYFEENGERFYLGLDIEKD